MSNNAVDITFTIDMGLKDGNEHHMELNMDEIDNRIGFNEQVEVTHKEVPAPSSPDASKSKTSMKSNASTTHSSFLKRPPSLEFLLRAVTPRRTRGRKQSHAKSNSPSPSKILSTESPVKKSHGIETLTPKQSNRRIKNMRFRSLSPSQKLAPFFASRKNDDKEDDLDMKLRVTRINNRDQERMVPPKPMRSSPIEKQLPPLQTIYSRLPSDRSTSSNATDTSASFSSSSFPKANIPRRESDSALYSNQQIDHSSPLPLAQSPSRGSRSISEMLCNTALSFAYDSDNTDSSSRNGINLTFPHTNSLMSGGSTRVRSGVHSRRHNPYKPYFDKADFLVDNWATASEIEKAPVYGMALLVATTVIVHPFVFFAGAATAVWAVGTFHGVQQGYEFFTDKSFSSLFWNDENPMDALSQADDEQSLLDNQELIALQTKRLHEVKIKSMNENLDKYEAKEKDKSHEEKELQNKLQEKNEIIKTAVTKQTYLKENSLKSLSSTPRNKVVPSTLEIPPLHASKQPSSSSLTLGHLIKTRFPPLLKRVVKDVPFQHLNAQEFFNVFFSDNAPYSFKEFQKTRGDVDVVYEKWDSTTANSFMDKDNNTLSPIPHARIKERTCTFRTLTKSYFGPAYGSATKKQRMTLLKDRLLVLEGRTHLKGIPFGDRFHVDERWIIETTKEFDKKPTFSSTLSVYIDVVITQNCQFESQIKKKTLSTMIEMVEVWCKQATAALKLAEKERMKRAEKSTADSSQSVLAKGDSSALQSTSQKTDNHDSHSLLIRNPEQDQQLMEYHDNNIRALEESLTSCDLNDFGIEVERSFAPGDALDHTKILNPSGHEYESRYRKQEQTNQFEQEHSRQKSNSISPKQKKKKKRLRNKMIKKIFHLDKS